MAGAAWLGALGCGDNTTAPAPDGQELARQFEHLADSVAGVVDSVIGLGMVDDSAGGSPPGSGGSGGPGECPVAGTTSMRTFIAWEPEWKAMDGDYSTVVRMEFEPLDARSTSVRISGHSCTRVH